METDAPPTTWIVVGSPDNFAATRAHGFTIQGLKSRHRRKAEAMRPGDRIVWYITGAKAFAGHAEITGDAYEDHTPIWKSRDPKRDAEDYPWRLPIRAVRILEQDGWVAAEPLARQMHHASKWPAANWTLAFQGNVHKLDAHDGDLLVAAIDAMQTPALAEAASAGETATGGSSR